MKHYISLFILFILCGCSTGKTSFSWEKFRKENPGSYKSYYEDFKNIKLENRYVKLSPDIINFVRQHDPAEMPWLHSMVENLEENNPNIKNVRESFQRIPDELKNLISTKVYAWSLVKNLGSGARTVQLYSNDNDTVESLILFDETILKNSEDFLSKKEATVYKPGIYQIKVKLNRNIPVELYFLFHEAGHAFDVKNIFTNDGGTTFSEQAHVLWCPFTKLSWKWDGKKSIMPQQSGLETWPDSRKYYNHSMDDKLDNELVPTHFNKWKTTNFPSLYATTNVTEDWAESFASVILKKYYKTDIVYTLYKNDKEVESQPSCISNGLCQEKKNLLETFISYPQAFLAE